MGVTRTSRLITMNLTTSHKNISPLTLLLYRDLYLNLSPLGLVIKTWLSRAVKGPHPSQGGDRRIHSPQSTVPPQTVQVQVYRGGAGLVRREEQPADCNCKAELWLDTFLPHSQSGCDLILWIIFGSAVSYIQVRRFSYSACSFFRSSVSHLQVLSFSFILRSAVSHLQFAVSSVSSHSMVHLRVFSFSSAGPQFLMVLTKFQCLVKTNSVRRVVFVSRFCPS